MSLKKILTLGYTLVFSAFCLNALAQTNETDANVVSLIEKKRAEQLKELKGEKSPLEKKARKKLKHIDYYPIDLAYHVIAKFTKTETPNPFQMKRTRPLAMGVMEFVKYGEVVFTLNGSEYKLNVYQTLPYPGQKEKDDSLFLPFTDKTNGTETYEVGRYIDIPLPLSTEIVIDFNLAYNPYCSYNHNYSCPIPPAENDLPIEVKVGEKRF